MDVEIRHFHLFCGLGGGAKGFNKGEARVGSLNAKFKCIGGIDVDQGAIADFDQLAGVKGTVLDLFNRQQYMAFHGKEPPYGWTEATAADIQRAAGGERPHIVFLSAPCKGFSGLLPEAASKGDKYQALNSLTLRGVWLMLEAWQDDPPELIVFENVPRIMNRGRKLLDRIVALLAHYGYLVAETTHDCGHLGGLAQSRKRFLLVARHAEKIPPFLYEPMHRPLKGVGEVLERFPLPGDVAAAGPMHRIPSLQWKTWVRLAFIEAGSDWRSLKRLNVEDGFLKDFGIMPDQSYHQGVMGVTPWGSPAVTVKGRSTPTNGCYSVADPRIDGHPRSVQHGVRKWDQSTGVVTGKMLVGGGPHSVADPRMPPSKNRHNGFYRVVRWDRSAHVVTGAKHVGGAAMSVADPRGGHFNGHMGVTDWNEQAGTVAGESFPTNGKFSVADPRYNNWHPGASSAKLKVTDWGDPAYTITGAQQVASGALSVADPRPDSSYQGKGKYRVVDWDGQAGTVIGASGTGNGAFSVADPRPEFTKDGREHYQSGGHYGVVPWWDSAGAVSAAAQHDNGRWSVADPRVQPDPNIDPICQLPAPEDRLVVVIHSLDNTWHRPFTTLELAALQGLVCPEEHMELEGLSDSAWRERIGNAVPPPAAQAIASTMGRTLLMAWSGQTFSLSNEPIWVQPIATALSVSQSRNPA